MNQIIDIEELKNYLHKNNISERKFARMINIDHTTVNRVLNGNRNPGVKFISGLMNSELNLKKIFLTKQLPYGNKRNKL